ncbi:hypothetical protein ACTACV_12655 [Pseudomonas syringae]|uniref:hypothetical protein n=1 Tax=Pseudomonas syringae TaxID=317 RepID=UPI003F74BE7E
MDSSIQTSEELEKEIDALTDEIALAFLDKIQNRPCEACGTGDWFVIPDMKVAVWGEPLSPGVVNPVFVVSCMSCGNLRSFAWARVRYFMEKEYLKDGE